MAEQVEVEGRTEENAVRLLAAAEDLGLSKHVVKSTSDGFVVPKEVHDKAFGNGDDEKKKSAARSSSKSTKSKNEQGE